MMLQQHAIDHGDAEKDRRVILSKDLTDNFGRRLLAAENRSEAVQQRKSEAVAETICEWQTRRRKDPITFAQAQNFAAESFISVKDVRWSMHRAFRFAGAAGSVKNECRDLILSA